MMKKTSNVEKTSVLLRRTALKLQEDSVHVGILLYRLRRRSFGGLLFFLAILSLIPGVSIFTGVVMMVLGGQLSLGFRVPSLPRILSEYALPTEHLKTGLNRSATEVERLEKYLGPRLLILTSWPFNSFLGLFIFALAVLVTIPLPFTNLLPAVAIFTISLGVLERDGLVIIFGVILSLFSFIIGGAVVCLALQGLEALL